MHVKALTRAGSSRRERPLTFTPSGPTVSSSSSSSSYHQGRRKDAGHNEALNERTRWCHRNGYVGPTKLTSSSSSSSSA